MLLFILMIVMVFDSVNYPWYVWVGITIGMFGNK